MRFATILLLLGAAWADEGMRVTGRVRSAAGEPVREGSVAAYLATEPRQLVGRTRLRDGAFELALRMPPLQRLTARIEVVVTAPGFLPAIAEDPSPIVLRRGATVRGRLVSPDGVPVSGAFVWTIAPGAREPDRETESDDAGRFVLPASDGKRWICAAHPAHGAAAAGPRAQGDVGDLEIVRGEPLAGIVSTPDGKPVAGVPVVAFPVGRRPGDLDVANPSRDRGWLLGAPYGMTTTGPDGRFRIPNLRPGRYFVEAADPDEIDRDDLRSLLARLATHATHATKTENVRLTLRQPLLRVRVRDAGGRRLFGFRVTASSEGRSVTRVGGAEFLVPTQAGATWIVRAARPEIVPAETRATIVGAGVTTVDLVLAPATDRGGIDVRLGAVEVFRARVLTESGVLVWKGRVDDGRLPRLPAGRYRLLVEPGADVTAPYHPIETTAEVRKGETTELRLEARAGGRVAFVFRAPNRRDGSTLDGYGVTLRAGEGAERPAMLVDPRAGGSFGFPSYGRAAFVRGVLVPGTYRVRLKIDGFRLVRRTVEVRAGEVTEVAVDLRPH